MHTKTVHLSEFVSGSLGPRHVSGYESATIREWLCAAAEQAVHEPVFTALDPLRKTLLDWPDMRQPALHHSRIHL